MTDSTHSQDESEIIAIVARMFDAISWNPDQGPDLDGFAQPVLPEAILVPSARPAAPTDIVSFTDRMRRLHAESAMATFSEKPLTTVVHLFGNIAVAIGGYEMQVDGDAPARGANAFLFVRTETGWKVAGLAWDSERPGLALDASLS
ncbi:DUF4440 domain-containing protein [Sphingosinicella humi]|uniref:DUF4440 domain-containing protein n=1 Tax=Allosphingosinicella humi TaxID=2068657 RepID=A0A2U2J5A6_9SPHN|nr:DUF4440 domain-containing protein [Sphingosinicella humi]PWG03497.1 DUF4440 domain-containing protein [Sphingosinicella humi]